ncbi:MAG: PD40 domain-containing protein [Bacteroidia bacterium]|nr:PD40 domain-containing protein [Bacteroidia bacterium]
MRIKGLILLFWISSLVMRGQFNSFVLNEIEVNIAEKHIAFYNKAKLSIETRQYNEAVAPLDSLLKIYPNVSSLNFLGGITKIFSESKKKSGLVELKRASVRSNELPDYTYWLARAYEINDSINQATTYYNKFLSEKKPVTEEEKELIQNAQKSLDNLKTAGQLKNYSNFANIKNVGYPLNTDASEYVPLVPSDESFMIFTYRGKFSKGGKQDVTAVMGISSAKAEEKIYFEDVFISQKVNDSVWSEPKPIKNINSALHDAAVTISADGTLLFIYKNTGKGNGDLYLSKLVGNTWSVPVIQIGLNSEKWDGSAAFFPDNNKIIFSSERKGGFGGKDLYMAEKIAENTWGNIVNLGGTINSSADEDAPFITADGKILFFASNGKLSTGGYDILRSDLSEKGWSAPFNIGKPVNTPNDDKFYMVTADSKKGYYSSMMAGGYGEQDIYCITPGIPDRPVRVVQVSGNITYNNKPVGGKLEVKNLSKPDAKPFVYFSNSGTGKFLANLAANEEYELKFSYKNLEPQTKTLSTKGVDSTKYLTVIADFYSEAVQKQMEKSRDSINAVALAANKKVNFDDFRSKYGNLILDSTTYFVQIAAYKFIENYDYSTCLRINMKIRRSSNDLVTRFTVGNYSTFNEAEEKLKVLKEQGIKDAFIIVFHRNKYRYLVDLIKAGVYK